MNDLLPRVSAPAGAESWLHVERWRHLEQTFFSHASRYGFSEVRPPLCEYTDLFSRGVGDTTDIVEKEMYTFEDRGGRHLSLRPEGTASAVRAALEHNALAREPVVRWAYAGPMFRAERPAKGRYRQFHQVGAELYGDASPAADAEMIALAAGFLSALGVNAFRVRVNSLGTRASRKVYRDALIAHFTPQLAALSPESQSRLQRNPLRILDSKDPRDIAAKAGAPSLTDSLSAEDQAHFAAVCAMLDALGVPYTVDPSLVRGLDYYTRTVFEIVDVSGALGAQDALGGGGRYDDLFADLGAAQPVPAVGFAMGIERLLLAAPEASVPRATRVAVVAAARADEQAVLGAALALARDLRGAGVETHVDTRFGSMKSQMRRANDLKVDYVFVLGGNEVAAGTVSLKTMADDVAPEAKQVTLTRAEAIARVLPASR